MLSTETIFRPSPSKPLTKQALSYFQSACPATGSSSPTWDTKLVSREKCASQHPPGNLDNHESVPLHWQCVSNVAPSRISHLKCLCTTSQAQNYPSPPFKVCWTVFSLTELNPNCLFIWYSLLSMIQCQPCFPFSVPETSFPHPAFKCVAHRRCCLRTK